MTPAYTAVQKFYDLYFGRDSIAYWLGAKGEILTMQHMRDLVNWNPEYWSAWSEDQIEALMRWSEGKIGYDCSGLVCACYGISGLSSWALRDAMVRTSSVKECKAGSVLWKPGHVEIDLGFGASGGIRSPGNSIVINDNGTAGFELGGELPNVDYSMMYNF